MKRIICLLSLLCVSNIWANDNNIIEFNFKQGFTVFQINTVTGELAGLINNSNGQACLYKMDFKESKNNIFRYEKNSGDQNYSLYQQLEIDLNTNTSRIYSTRTNTISEIPIQRKNCLSMVCSNLSNISPC